MEPNAATIVPWTRTDPNVGNRWRGIARGARVYSFPIWLYCDDVSGNQSKKWNKHYSFLFSPAGLPRALFQHEYNVHFLCTSNLAAPLEMMDGIVSQLEYVLVSLRYRAIAYVLTRCEPHRGAWQTGVWVWDCVHEDHVLIIPFVAALLGDNPMQSEFACHVGPGGKFLCRICDVKGMDASANGLQSPTAPASIDRASEGRTTPDSIGTSDSDGDGNSSASNTSAPADRRKRKVETMQEMVERITRFVQTGSPRTRDSTLAVLHTIIADAGSIGNVSKIKAHKTSTGVKDTFLDTFLELMHQSYKKSKVSRPEKQIALDNFRATLPENARMVSPVWRIRGIVSHLHYVLCAS